MDTRKQDEHFIKIFMALAILCVPDIQCTEKASGFSIDLRETVPSEIRLDLLSQAIDEFAVEYKVQHGTGVQITLLLKPTDGYPCKQDNSCQSVLLEFSFAKDDKRVQASVIVEMPYLGKYYETSKKISLYAKEKYMYETVLPLMYRSWSHEKLSPNFYASKKSEILIIENLIDSSYFMKDSLLDSVEQCKLVFKSLAQFHALSIAHLSADEYSDLRSLTSMELMRDFGLASATMIENHVQYVAQLLTQPIPSSMKEEIRHLKDNLASVYPLIYLPSENFNVVLHGLLKRKTVYFKRESESRDFTGCKFVDFRLSRLGSPVVDLVTYLITSVQFEVFEKNQNSLFSYYLEELHKTLAEMELGCEYHLKDLQADLRRYKPYFLRTLIYYLPVTWADPVPLNMDQIFNTFREALGSNTYLSHLENWMRILPVLT